MVNDVRHSSNVNPVFFMALCPVACRYDIWFESLL